MSRSSALNLPIRSYLTNVRPLASTVNDTFPACTTRPFTLLNSPQLKPESQEPPEIHYTSVDDQNCENPKA